MQETTLSVMRAFGQAAALGDLVIQREECLELRVKDIDVERREIVVRRGKGRKDRRTMLPAPSANGCVHI